MSVATTGQGDPHPGLTATLALVVALVVTFNMVVFGVLWMVSQSKLEKVAAERDALRDQLNGETVEPATSAGASHNA
jgi:hypothetical protein